MQTPAWLQDCSILASEERLGVSDCQPQAAHLTRRYGADQGSSTGTVGEGQAVKKVASIKKRILRTQTIGKFDNPNPQH